MLTGSVATASALVAGALAAWSAMFVRMRGMDAGLGTDLGGLVWFLSVWVTMMAAMMLPSVAPMVLTFTIVSRERFRRGQAKFVPTWAFLAGYLLVWAAYGLVAYGVFRLARAGWPHALSWDAGGPYVAGAALFAAGVYQATALKSVCLRHCRGPLHFVLGDWKEGKAGALRMGIEHGAYCVGCCWGLMLALFALGVMSLFWMAVVAAVIFAEKVLPFGERLTRPIAVAFAGLAVWVALVPSSVPGLVQPNSSMAREMGGSSSMSGERP